MYDFLEQQQPAVDGQVGVVVAARGGRFPGHRFPFGGFRQFPVFGAFGFPFGFPYAPYAYPYPYGMPYAYPPAAAPVAAAAVATIRVELVYDGQRSGAVATTPEGLQRVLRGSVPEGPGALVVTVLVDGAPLPTYTSVSPAGQIAALDALRAAGTAVAAVTTAAATPGYASPYAPQFPYPYPYGAPFYGYGYGWPWMYGGFPGPFVGAFGRRFLFGGPEDAIEAQGVPVPDPGAVGAPPGMPMLPPGMPQEMPMPPPGMAPGMGMPPPGMAMQMPMPAPPEM